MDLLAVAPAGWERELAEHPEAAPSILGALGEALVGRRGAEAGEALVAAVRARFERWEREGLRPEDRKIDDLLTLMLVAPRRFATDRAFREVILALVPAMAPPPGLPALRDRLLAELDSLVGIDFAASERIEVAWGAAPRASLERELHSLPDSLSFPSELEGALEASIYSLPRDFVPPAEATRFLQAVRRIAPDRRLLVLTDHPPEVLAGTGATLLPTRGRPYSPWPRDPFTLARDGRGGVVLLLRPDAQPGREEDAFLGLELLQELPPELDERWGRVRWHRVGLPFHNGQLLRGDDELWLTLHSVEPRVLEILGLDRVPVASFGTEEGCARYLAAVRQAGDELAALEGRHAHFVHDLVPDPATMRLLGGGAGFDLDSLVTLLPGERALVADLSRGSALLAAVAPGEWGELGAGLGLSPPPAQLPILLGKALAEPRMVALGRFLDHVADHLAQEGRLAGRLPLLAVPTALLAEPFGHPELLLGWNNVVLEEVDGELRAEGFSSLLPTGDEVARRAFAAVGVRLRLLPPLVRSVLLNGGYRCASNHLRSAAPRSAQGE